MKKIFYVVIACCLLTACSGDVFKAGKEINEEGALTNAILLEKIKGKDSLETKVGAKINSVCSVKGCWMKLDMGNGQEMRVTFKDYAFFVPKDAAGKEAVVQGWVKSNTLSVEEARHYAKDAGKSAAEIEKITEPVTELTFVADGVIIK